MFKKKIFLNMSPIKEHICYWMYSLYIILVIIIRFKNTYKFLQPIYIYYPVFIMDKLTPWYEPSLHHLHGQSVSDCQVNITALLKIIFLILSRMESKKELNIFLELVLDLFQSNSYSHYFRNKSTMLIGLPLILMLSKGF